MTDAAQPDYQQAQEKLLSLQQEYEQRIDKINHDMRNPASDMVEDWDDQAIVTEQNDMHKSLLVEAQANLEQVNNALRRIENDNYGVCSVCGEDIEPQRLVAVPYATTCIQHAE